MALALAGAPNAVATCGTALADDHFGILKNFARKVVLAYDGDAAGQGAAERWYAWEQRFDIQVQVADLPAGRDPADLWHDDPERLLRAVGSAKPFLEFRIDRAIAVADRGTIEGRARAAEAAAAIVAEHPSDLVRDQYVMKLAGELDIEADRLRDAVARAVSARARDAAGSARGSSTIAEERARRSGRLGPTVDRREADLLSWAIHSPELVVDWIDQSLFTDPVARAAYDALASAPTFHDALAGTTDDARDLLERLAVEEPVEDDEPETLRGRLIANAVVAPAQRVLAGFVRDDNPRANDLKVQLDALADSRAAGDWNAVLRDANQLLGWIAEGSRTPRP
jgi:DNA primase